MSPERRRTKERRTSTRRSPRGQRPDDTGRLFVQAWLGSRLLIGLTVALVMLLTGRKFIDAIANWDSEHFLRIGRQGYVTLNDTAFFPGLPALLGAGMKLGLPGDIVGVVISLVAGVVAGVALLRLGPVWASTGNRPHRADGGRRLGLWAAVCWFLAPTAVFTAVPYTEALFCAFAFWAWERAHSRRWLQMGVLAALACTVRVSGLFLLGALAVLILTGGVRADGGHKRKDDGPIGAAERGRGLVALLLPAATLGAYVVYQHARTGDWLAWYHAQTSGWSRGFAWPWESFLNTLPATSSTGYYADMGWTWIFRAEIVSMAVGVVVTLVCLWQRRWGEASWVGVQCLAFSLSYWWMSVNRAVLLWFPLWLILGQVATLDVDDRRRPWLRALAGVYLAASTVVLVAWTIQFCNGRWSS